MSYSKGDQGFSFYCAWQAGVITCLKVESGSLEDRSGRRRREEGGGGGGGGRGGGGGGGEEGGGGRRGGEGGGGEWKGGRVSSEWIVWRGG